MCSEQVWLPPRRRCLETLGHLFQEKVPATQPSSPCARVHGAALMTPPGGGTETPWHAGTRFGTGLHEVREKPWVLAGVAPVSLRRFCRRGALGSFQSPH